jgi:hypothetical protein
MYVKKERKRTQEETITNTLSVAAGRSYSLVYWSLVSISTGGAGWSGFDFLHGANICFFFTTSRSSFGSVQITLQWVRMFFPWRKTAGAWIWQPFTPHILPRIKNVWSFTSTYMSVLLWFITHKDRFIFLSVRFEVLWWVCSEDGVRMGAQIIGTGFPGRLNLVRWHVIFVGPGYGIWVMSHIWPRIVRWFLEFLKIYAPLVLWILTPCSLTVGCHHLKELAAPS